MTDTANPRCAYVKDDGSGCRAYAVNGSAFCFAHAPELEEERRRAREKGGKRRSLDLKEAEQKHLQTLDLPEPPTTQQEAAEYLSWIVDQTAKGFLSESLGRVLIQGVKAFLKARNAARKEEQLTERLRDIERKLGTTAEAN